MDSKVILCLLLFAFCGADAYKILVAFPIGSKSLHHLMSSLGLALAKAGHSVTHLTSFDAFVTHPNIEHLQPDDFSSDLYIDNVFDMDSHIALLDWVDRMLTTIPHKFWKDPEIWKLYNRRNEFDAIISTHYSNEAFLPFLDGYNGTYVIVCTPGIEYRCLSFSGNWPSPAIVSNFALPYDEFMTFYERIHNSITLAIEKAIEVTIMVPNFLKTIQTYFPHVNDVPGYYTRNHLTLINGHFALDSPVPLLPKQIEIGTINAKKAKPLPQDLEKVFDDAGPEGVIYFSMGSFVKGRDIPVKYKKILLEAFGRLKQTVILKYEENDLDLPPNVITRKWLPQQDILGHPQTKIFMSHCGNLGTQEAKFHGVLTTFSTAVLCLIVLLSVVEESHSISMDSSALEGLPSGALIQGAKAKRRIYDPSCKGIYDRELFGKLERVCEECYNLYRKPQVARECRRDCYTSQVFESCLQDLMMQDFISEYKEMAFMVAGKK